MMAKRKQIICRTTGDHFKFKEEKHLPVPDFYKKYKTKFPLLAIIIDGIYGETKYDCFDCLQVTRVHCCTSQPRVLCMREEDSTKPDSRYTTIPVKTPQKFRVIRSRKKEPEMNDTACMLAFTKEITLTPILGFKYRTEDEFKLLQRRLDKKVARHPEQYDKTDGNPTTKPPIPEVDADDAFDYDIPEIDKFPIPKATPKFPDRKHSVTEAVDPKQTKGVLGKHRNLPQNTPRTGLEVHESVSGQKDSGYDNTKIGRAVVRPQLKIPDIPYDDVDYEIYSPVYEEPATELTRGHSPRDQGNSTSRLEPHSSTPAKSTHKSNTKEHQTSTISRNTCLPAENHFEGVGKLSIAEVSDVLKELNLDKYVDSFRSNTIDGEILSELDVEDFVNELGLKKLEAVRLSKYVKTGHVPK